MDLDRTVYSTAQPDTPGTLFETFADRVLRRVDEVIAGRNCAWQPNAHQVEFLRLIRSHQGKRRAVALTLIAERMQLSQRSVKELVQDLRMSFGVQVGASRDAGAGGYYVVETEAESDETCSVMWSQAMAMLRVYYQLRRGRQTLAEMTAQIGLELKEGTK